MVVVKRNVNLRADPSSANPPIRLLPAGEEGVLTPWNYVVAQGRIELPTP